MKKKRLFIFAAYDKDSIIDPTLIYYLNALSKLGDIVFTMDNNVPNSELDKVRTIPNVLNATATRHKEYDFGSYKIGYTWARDNKLLSKYNWIYLINDSVFGPLWGCESLLNDLESRGSDMIGLVETISPYLPAHIQSWFVGITNKIATSDFFDEFITNVKHQENKSHVVLKYEIRLTRMVLSHGYKISALYQDKMTENTSVVYDNPKIVLDSGIPFIKKMAVKHQTQIEYLLPYTTDDFIDSIFQYAIRYNCPNKIPYQNNYSFRLLGLPIYSVKSRRTMWATTDYKVCLFGKIPFIKITKKK